MSHDSGIPRALGFTQRFAISTDRDEMLM